KIQRTNRCLSVRGSKRRVAERKESVVVAPHKLEAAEVPNEVSVEEPIHSRNAAAALGVFRQAILLVHRRIPVTLRQLATLRVDKLDSLRAHQVRLDRREVRQALLARG